VNGDSILEFMFWEAVDSEGADVNFMSATHEFSAQGADVAFLPSDYGRVELG